MHPSNVSGRRVAWSSRKSECDFNATCDVLDPGAALAADNPLSVHVLNIQNGLPSPDVAVTLERHENGKWIELNEVVTNGQGRMSALYPEGEDLVDGTYRVVFETGERLGHSGSIELLGSVVFTCLPGRMWRANILILYAIECPMNAVLNFIYSAKPMVAVPAAGLRCTRHSAR